MPEQDPADRGPQPEGAPARQSSESQPAASEQPPINGGSTSATTEQRRSFFPEVEQRNQEQAEQKELDRVRQQLGTVKQEYLQTKAGEVAQQHVAQERRGQAWWQRAAEAVKQGPAFFARGQRQKEYVRDYERRQELKDKLATLQTSDTERGHLQTELSALETKLGKGQGVKLTEQEQRLFYGLERIIGTKRGELDLEDQKLKDRAETGKLIEWFRSHPNAKTGLLAAGVGLMAGAALPLLGVFGAGAMAIKGGLAGGVAGLAGQEARVHTPTAWARDLGLLARDKGANVERYKTAGEMADMTNQELVRAVGVMKNALEQGKVGGSRGEYLRMWAVYRQANDLLVSRDYMGRIAQGTEQSTQPESIDRASFRQLTETVRAKMRATDIYDQLLRSHIAEQEWATYVSIQKGKGKQQYGAAILGATIGSVVGGMYGLWTEQGRPDEAMRSAVDEWHKVYREGILRQQERAVAKTAELAQQGVQAVGMEPNIVNQFSEKVGRESVQSLADFARNYNISLSHPLYEPNVTFGQWLNSNAEWFRGLSPNLQGEILSHPNLGPILLEKGQAGLSMMEGGLISLGGLMLGGLARKGLERAGKDEIKHDLEASKDRYGKAGKEAWEVAKKTAETEKTEEGGRVKTEKEELERRMNMIEVGQLYELNIAQEGQAEGVWEVYRVKAVGNNPQVGERVAEMTTEGGKTKLVPLKDLANAEETHFAGFATEEAPQTPPAPPAAPARPEQRGKGLTPEKIDEIIAQFSIITERSREGYKKVLQTRDSLVKRGILKRDPNHPGRFLPTGEESRPILTAYTRAVRRTRSPKGKSPQVVPSPPPGSGEPPAPEGGEQAGTTSL